MNPRLMALQRVLAKLPPASDKAWFWPKPKINEDGAIEFVKPRYFKSLEQAFEAFRAGEFGFAVGDKNSLTCLEAWSKRTGKDPFDPATADCLDREACLLIWRFFDRQERIADGAWTQAHSSGLLHAVLRRLVNLEAN